MVFFLRKLYSMSLKVSCFISDTTFGEWLYYTISSSEMVALIKSEVP